MNAKSLFVQSQLFGNMVFSEEGKSFLTKTIYDLLNQSSNPIRGWFDKKYIDKWLLKYENEHDDYNILYFYGVGVNGNENNIESVIEELYVYFLSDCIEDLESEQVRPMTKRIKKYLTTIEE